MSYYPTTPLSSEELAQAIRTAAKQDAAVLAIFRRLRLSLLTPSDVHVMLEKYAPNRKWLKTSVRRSLSTLTDREKLLVKTDTLRRGPHGKPEHCWRLAAQVERTVPPACEMAGA